MDNIDIIIDYLSGTMTKSQLDEFVRRLGRDIKLNDEYQQVTIIWEAAKEKLRLRGLPPDDKKDELIAEVLAHLDIPAYSGPPRNMDEVDFLERLKSAEQKAGTDQKSDLARKNKTRLIAMLIAANLLLALIPDRGLYSLATRYYQPREIIPEAYRHTTRDNDPSGIYFFYHENYKKALEKFEKRIPGLNDLEKYAYAMSIYESGFQEPGISMLQSLAHGSCEEVRITSAWNLSLIYIQQGNLPEAIYYLELTKQSHGEYRRRAGILLKKIQRRQNG